MKPLFIIGCPRSGTTMLQQALNRHSRIVIPPETKFFSSFYKRSLRQQRKHWERIQRDLGIDEPAPGRRVADPQTARLLYDAIGRAYVDGLAYREPVYFGDKTPEHTGHLQWIWQVFPEAKVLFLYRDGRDVGLSLSQTPWMRCDVRAGFLIWLSYAHILRRLRQTRDERVQFIRYEDLVTEPDDAMSHICDFLDLPYEVVMARGSGNTEGIPQREYPWKGRALKPITSDRVGVWRWELDETALADLQWFGHSALQTLGYESAETTPPLRFRAAIRMAVSASQCLARLPWSAVKEELWGFLFRSLAVSANNREGGRGNQKSCGAK